MPPVRMIDPATGGTYLVPEEDVALRARDGWTAETIEGQVERVTQAKREEDYGGVVGSVTGAGFGVLRGVTAGLSDVVYSGLGEGDTLRNIREVNPGESIGGEIVGAVGGSFIGATPAGAIANLGNKVAARGTIGAAVKGGVVEGALTGAGEALSEAALSEDGLTVERLGSALSSNVLYGGAIGGAAGGAGKLLEKGLVRAKGALDEFAASRAGVAPDVADDLAKLDRPQLAEVRTAEVEKLVAEQTAGKVKAAAEVDTYLKTVQDANPWLVVTEGEPAKLLQKSKRQLTGLLDDPTGLAKNPAVALKALRVQEQALSRALDDAEGITKKLAAQNKKLAKDLGEELATLPDNLDEVVLAGSSARRYGAYANVKVAKGGSVTLNRQQAAEFLEVLQTGKITGSADESFKKLPGLLEQNRGLQQRIEGLTLPKGELTSPRLQAIDAAKDGLAGRKEGFGERMAGGAAYSTAAGLVGSIPLVGGFLAPFVGAKAADLVGSQVVGRLGKTASQAAERTSKAIGTFLDVTSRVPPVAPVLATKVLGAVAFGPDKGEQPAKLAPLYAKRSQQIRDQVEPGPDGQPMMRQQARQAMASRLAGVRAASPLLADKLETQAARRVEFLASKLPKRPDVARIPTGPDRWQPSDFAMRQWARYVAAVEDPNGVAERLAAGTVTPEDAEVMRKVYPEQLADLTQQIMAQLPTLQEQLPYKRRLALSILTGVPVDPAMEPRVLRVLQAAFAAEPGTEGGTQAPTPQPQFGSVRAAPGTLSQRRAEGDQT